MDLSSVCSDDIGLDEIFCREWACKEEQRAKWGGGSLCNMSSLWRRRWVVMRTRVGKKPGSEIHGNHEIMEAIREFQERLGWGSVLEAAMIRVPSNRIYNSKCWFLILMRTTVLVARSFGFVKYCPSSGAGDKRPKFLSQIYDLLARWLGKSLTSQALFLSFVRLRSRSVIFWSSPGFQLGCPNCSGTLPSASCISNCYPPEANHPRGYRMT